MGIEEDFIETSFIYHSNPAEHPDAENVLGIYSYYSKEGRRKTNL
jgi:hypothetical protein